MSQHVNYYRIGLFVIGAVLVGLVVLVVLGGRTYFGTERILLESYFDESVEGLDIGSSVTRRGVKIGRVYDIGFVRDVYGVDPEDPAYDLYQRSVRVVIEFNAERVGQTETEVRVRIRDEVNRGLRVYLRPKGLTGTARLEVDFDERGSEPPPPGWNPKGIYLPSAPGTLDRVASGIDRILYQFDQIDLDAVFSTLLGLLDEVRTTNLRASEWFASVQQQDLGGLVGTTLRDADALFVSTQRSIEDIGRAVEAATAQLDGVGSQVSETFAEVDVTGVVERAEGTLARLDYLLADGQRDLVETLANLRSVSANLAELTALLKGQPSLAAFGAAPAPATATRP